MSPAQFRAARQSVEFKLVDGALNYDLIKQYWKLLREFSRRNTLETVSALDVSLEEGLAPIKNGQVFNENQMQIRLVRAQETVIHVIVFAHDQIDHFKLELEEDCAQDDRKFLLRHIKALHKALFGSEIDSVFPSTIEYPA